MARTIGKKKIGKAKYTDRPKPAKVVINPASAQAPAAATPAVATLTAGAGRAWDLFRVGWSYSAAPTGGKLTIAWTDSGGNARSEVYHIIAGGPGELTWPVPLTMPSTVAPTITLASGGGAVLGTVYYMAINRKI